MKLVEIADKISVHLKRFEKDPQINKLRPTYKTHAKDNERIRNALLMCGCDPDNPKAEVGIVLRNSI